jgi:hypothetical protein
MVNSLLSISPRGTAFPGGLSYGGDGVPGVYDEEHILSHIKESDRADARRYFARALAKGGACPVGGAAVIMPAVDDSVVLPDTGGQVVKPSRKRANDDGAIEFTAPAAPPAA